MIDTLGSFNCGNGPAEFISWQVQQLKTCDNGIRKRKLTLDIAELRFESGGNVLQNITYFSHGAYEFGRRNFEGMEYRKITGSKEEEDEDECGRWNWSKLFSPEYSHCNELHKTKEKTFSNSSYSWILCFEHIIYRQWNSVISIIS